MTRAERFCLISLLAILALWLGSLPRAPAQFFWFLRVGVPEVGALLCLTALPAALWLARKSPRVGLSLLGLIALGTLWPWAQAWGIARALPAAMQRAFPGRVQERYPLVLGPRLGEVSLLTEPYRDRMEWDRYQLRGQPPRARILFVHGGSWRNGTRKDYPQLMVYLASRGYEVVSLTYSLAPERPYPSAPDDIEFAIARLHDPKVPLYLVGRSSGGHLALLASYRNPEKVAGVIAYYAPVDMVWSWENPSNPAVLDSQEAIGQFLGGPPWERPAVYREASPIHQLTEGGPATLLVHGRRDSLVYLRQSQMLSAQLIRKGVRHYLLELPWTEHGGDVTVYGPTGRLSAYAIESFIENGPALNR